MHTSHPITKQNGQLAKSLAALSLRRLTKITRFWITITFTLIIIIVVLVVFIRVMNAGVNFPGY